MNAVDGPSASPDMMLSELAALGMRAARVVVRMMEIEQQAADVAARWLPGVDAEPASLSEAVAAGQGMDAVAATMERAVPRVEMLARALDRVSRGLRRCIALNQRLAAGWPRAVAADDRAAMVRRQVARGVAEAIARDSDPETAERLFDDLAERLDDPGLEREIEALPVEQVVRRICRDLGLAAEALQANTDNPSPGVKGTTVPLRGAGQRPAGLPPDSC